MTQIKYDNDGDRFKFGYDAGVIRDGTVVLDETTGNFVIVDEDGVGFDVQAVLANMVGDHVRITMVSFKSLQAISSMMSANKEESVNILNMERVETNNSVNAMTPNDFKSCHYDFNVLAKY
jgi:hypothetical protein